MIGEKFHIQGRSMDVNAQYNPGKTIKSKCAMKIPT